jgi:hypothetical protein
MVLDFQRLPLELRVARLPSIRDELHATCGFVGFWLCLRFGRRGRGLMGALTKIARSRMGGEPVRVRSAVSTMPTIVTSVLAVLVFIGCSAAPADSTEEAQPRAAVTESKTTPKDVSVAATEGYCYTSWNSSTPGYCEFYGRFDCNRTCGESIGFFQDYGHMCKCDCCVFW